jgi:hypothetical protein
MLRQQSPRTPAMTTSCVIVGNAACADRNKAPKPDWLVQPRACLTATFEAYSLNGVLLPHVLQEHLRICQSLCRQSLFRHPCANLDCIAKGRALSKRRGRKNPTALADHSTSSQFYCEPVLSVCAHDGRNIAFALNFQSGVVTSAPWAQNWAH